MTSFRHGSVDKTEISKYELAVLATISQRTK